MTNREKCEMLKSTIYQLFTNEGRSKSYISRLLEIDRKVLSQYITQQGFPENKSKRHLPPAAVKFIKTNKDFIKKHLNEDDTITNIAAALKIDRKKLYNIFSYDEELNQVFKEFQARKAQKTAEKHEKEMAESRLSYDFEPLEGELWKPILGYDNYFISNFGRVKKYIPIHKADCLLKTQINPLSGREYIRISKEGKGNNFYIARLVGFAFLKQDYSEIKNTINHKDGNVLNNHVDNLEWISQAENNLHAYRVLNRSTVDKKRYHFDKILYKGKYEFNTVAAFTRFLGKSETQTRRYMDEPEKHDISFIIYNNDCND